MRDLRRCTALWEVLGASEVAQVSSSGLGGVGRVEAQKRAQSSRGCPDEEIARAFPAALPAAGPGEEVRRDHPALEP